MGEAHMADTKPQPLTREEVEATGFPGHVVRARILALFDALAAAERERDEARVTIDAVKREADEARADLKRVADNRGELVTALAGAVRERDEVRDIIETQAATVADALRGADEADALREHVATLEQTVAELNRELAVAERACAEWRKVTGYAEPDDLDFSLGRAGVDYHLNVQAKRAEAAERGCQSLRAELEAERTQTTTLLSVIRRCGETFAHALQNVRHLTGGDEKRMRAMLDEIEEEMGAPPTPTADAKADAAPACGAADDGDTCVLAPGHAGVHDNGRGTSWSRR